MEKEQLLSYIQDRITALNDAMDREKSGTLYSQYFGGVKSLTDLQMHIETEWRV